MTDSYLAPVGVLAFVGGYYLTDAMVLSATLGVVAAGIWYSLPAWIKPDAEAESE